MTATATAPATTATPATVHYSHATPEQLEQAALLRAAGYSLPTISEKVGLSVSTLSRHFKRLGVMKGTIKQELIDKAQRELLDTIASPNPLRLELADLIQSDISITRQLREKMAMAVEKLDVKSLSDAVIAARAGAAISTALKNTSDTIVHHLERPAVKNGEPRSFDINKIFDKETLAALGVLTRRRPTSYRQGSDRQEGEVLKRFRPSDGHH